MSNPNKLNEEVAKHVVKGFQSNDDLRTYIKGLDEDLWKLLARSYKVTGVIRKLKWGVISEEEATKRLKELFGGT